MSKLSQKHLLGIKDITRDDIELIFDTADNFKEVINRPIKKVPSLRDVTIANIFLKTPPARACPLSLRKRDCRPTL
jgi:aspartate carbamoyltransferase catalytic subunit